MGGKDSKPSFLSYDDAIKRVSDSELRRLRESFKRLASINNLISQQTFTKDVLGDTPPLRVAERMYTVFGGTTKGISFKDLISGLVLLTMGKEDERIKFVYGFYINPQSFLIERQHIDSLLLATEGSVPISISQLFLKSETVTFEKFRLWLLTNVTFSSISKWMLEDCDHLHHPRLSLSGASQTPTFHQTLAGVTHLEEDEIMELEKQYWSLKSKSLTGKLDLDTFKSIVCPPIPEELCQGLFNAFDNNNDNHLDFKELACGISACCRGPTAQRLKFVFKIFDTEKCGHLTREQVSDMIVSMLRVRHLNDHIKDNESAIEKESSGIVTSIYERWPIFSLDNYLLWSIDKQLTQCFLQLLFEICHVLLGLRPVNIKDESDIISGWLERTEAESLQMGQVWYLVSIQWWNLWCKYVDYKDQPMMPIELETTSNVNTKWSSKHDSYSGSNTNDGITGLGYTSLHHRHIQHNGVNSAPLHRTLEPSPVHSRTTTPEQSPSLGRRNDKTTANMANKYSRASRPCPIDNTSLLVSNNTTAIKMNSLTNEGGKLRRDKMLTRDRDFKLVPEPVWHALSSWYGFSISLPRTVIKTRPGDPMELELYPYTIRIYKHQLASQSRPAPSAAPTSSTTTSNNGVFSGIIEGLGGSMSNNNNQQSGNKYLAHMAAFSSQHTLIQCIEFLSLRLRINKDDFRLWSMQDMQNKVLLEDEMKTLKELGLKDDCQLLLEVRNMDLTWPEEMYEMMNNNSIKSNDKKENTMGLTGLNNLGNTCFMNAALQCISNTKILTQYFITGTHFYELNKSNPVGMKGHLAQRYGELINDLWKGSKKAVAPLKLRYTIGKYEQRFSGMQQHDSQELLLFVLDGLHEDLNRVHKKPYVELKDSDGRPDDIVASEAWDNHQLRNQSIIIDLFHGQMKSTVQCCVCNHTSVRFEVIPPLSLPLPIENFTNVSVIVLPLDGTTPNRYTIRLSRGDTYSTLKHYLYKLCTTTEVNGPEVKALLLFEVFGAVIKNFPKDDEIFKPCFNGTLYAYEITSHLSNIIAIYDKNNEPKKSTITHNDSVPLLLNTLTNGGEPAVNTGADGVVNNEEGATKLPRYVNFNYVVAVHRKMVHMETYFLSAMQTRPSLFGTPIIVSTSPTMINSDLYASVWHQVARLMAPTTDNHAHDGDTSKTYPFTLKMVTKDGLSCSICSWNRYCLGCILINNDHKFLQSRTPCIAIDWDPTALHLRYQTSSEKHYNDQVAEEDEQVDAPISLQECLKAFTSVEELGKDELYYCSSCCEQRMAIKKLDLWKLPPILVIHLKRFQLVNNSWVKSQKVVEFPFTNFNPSSYVSVHGLNTKPEGDINSNETLTNGISEDVLNSEYDLYAISCHSGQMGAGHYVCYAKISNGKWYCYNDSSCKEVEESKIDNKSAYILFYERKGLDAASFMPNIKDKLFDKSEIIDDFDTDFKKTCTIQ